MTETQASKRNNWSMELYKSKTEHNKGNNQQSQETTQRTGESNTSDMRLASKKWKEPERFSRKKQESWLNHNQVIWTDISQQRCMNGLRVHEKVFNISNYQHMQIKAGEGNASPPRMTNMEGRRHMINRFYKNLRKMKTDIVYIWWAFKLVWLLLTQNVESSKTQD